MKHSTLNTLLLTCFLQLSILMLPTVQVKVSIKSHVDDWCVRAKGPRAAVILDKCYWKANFPDGKMREKEQTFDVHPEDDVDEQIGRTKTQDGKLPTPFLIRLSKSSTVPAPTSCLASISFNLTVEKCHLRKSRFRISGSTLAKSHSNLCTPKTHQPSRAPTSYKILSSDQSCLEFIPATGSMSKPAFVFAKCASEKPKKVNPTHLWQFCGKNGNCSLSPIDLNWDAMISVEPSEKMNSTDCPEEKAVTTATTTTTTLSPSSPAPTTETITAADLIETFPVTENSSLVDNNNTTHWNGETFPNGTSSNGGIICRRMSSVLLWKSLVLLAGKHFIVNFNFY